MTIQKEMEEMNNKAHLRPKDFDSNGDIIPMACKEEKGDLISREALRKAFHGRIYYFDKSSWDEANALIDNAPPVEPEKVLFANVTFDEDKLKEIVQTEVIEKIKSGELVIKDERPQVVLFAENITEEEKQKLIAEIKAVMDNTKFTEEPERPKGEWHHYTQTLNFNTFYITECPYCGLRVKEETNFCPNCGADMKGGAE